MAALEYVTKDGDVSVLGPAIIAESYVAATARAQAAEGRTEELKREQKTAGTYVIVRGIGAIDDSNIQLATSTRTRTPCRRADHIRTPHPNMAARPP
eukprot:448483-Prymnesium_polylepis.1